MDPTQKVDEELSPRERTRQVNPIGAADRRNSIFTENKM